MKQANHRNEGNVAIIFVFLMAMVIITIISSKIVHVVRLELEAGNAVLNGVVERYQLIATDTERTR